jgi:peptidyl-prolyl isomerase D
MARPRAFLDIDIDGWRAAYANAEAFVAATNLRYGLSSDKLEDLGGSEKARIRKELFANDYEWSSKGNVVTRRRPERLVVELWPDVSPLACQNFLALITGEKGRGECGKPLHYKGCAFHRVVPGFVAQTGDLAFGNGSGGESIWGKKFKDDRGGLKRKLDRRGLLAMGNTGKNSNTSQFFITFAALPKLTGKHVVFGEVLLSEPDAETVMGLLEASGEGGGAEEAPSVPVVIADCGLLPPGGSK